MNQNFFLWYYSKGLSSMLLFPVTLFRYVAHRFHILGLLATLFSPWKRDAASGNWAGFHPLWMLQTLAGNLISRFLGMLVRLVVIGVGLIVLLLCSIVGVVLLGAFLVAPLLLLGGIMLFLTEQGIGLVSFSLFLLGILGFLLAVIGFMFREQEEGETFDIMLLKRRSWWKQLLGRLGFEKKDKEVASLTSTEAFLELLSLQGINRDVFESAVRFESAYAEKRVEEERFFSWENLKKHIPFGKGWRYAYTSHLDRYALDLSSFDPEYKGVELIGRAETLQMLTLVLERPSQNNVLLVSEPGTGKKTLIHYLARLIRENAFIGTPLGESRVLIFDPGRAVSDALNQGEDVDNALRALLGEAYYAGNVILVVENIDTLFGTTSSRPSLAPVFGEFLSLPNFRLIATTTPGRYHVLEKNDDPALNFFETVYMRETTEEETLQVLLNFVRRVEGKNTVFTLPGLLSIVAQSSRYKWEVPMPERALDLAQEVLTYWQSQSEERFITPKLVEAFVGLKTGMPIGAIGAEEKDKLLGLEQYLHERVIGQDEAVRQVAEAMRRARAGFGDAKRPLGSFIFLGPTGVGKTETVKAFAESYFGDENRMIRLDMSEYQGAESVGRLIGSEAMGLHGQLTDLVKEKPYSLLLLDELEKAYPKALDLFLQILDEGFVTDGFGEKVSFRNTIIIATSNAGAPIIRDGIASGVPFEEIKKRVMDHIVEQGIYRLEFMNRFDGIIFFEPLKESELLQVTTLKLQAFADRLKKEKNITITFAPGVAEKIVERGYEPEFGARSINRYIEDTIEDAVVNQVIAGSVASGGTLSVTADQL